MNAPSEDITNINDIYFDHRTGNYWVKDNRDNWMKFNESSIKRLLKSYGITAECARMELLSPLDATILKIQRTKNIGYAASLAGYSKGIHRVNEIQVLVIDSPKIIMPVEGSFPLLTAIFDGMFNDPLIDQRPYAYGWLKIAHECLISGAKRPGQAFAMAGPRGSGKSLIQNLITEMLGGRAAKPYRYMSGKTDFNSELFQAEHLMIEDEIASTDLRTRRNFGSHIKQVTVNVTQSCHPKGQQAITLKPFWRTTITLNDEPENLLILPPFDESILDKIILLKVSKKPFPAPMTTLAERDAFYNNLLLELPAFLYFLSKWEIPLELKCDRYGITHCHHPELIKELQTSSPEHALLEIIDMLLFHSDESKQPFWMGTARELEQKLKTSAYRTDVEKLLTFQTAMGTYLGRLQVILPKRVIGSRTSDTRSWVIMAPLS